MIWLILFNLFFWFSLKDNLFLRRRFYIDSQSIFMVSISPLVLFLLFWFPFAYHKENINNSYKILFTLLICVVSLVFMSSDPFLFLVLLELSIPVMFALILIFSKDFDKYSSLFFIIVINILGSIPFIFFVYTYFIFFFRNFFLRLTESVRWFIFLSYCLVLISKLPIFLFHFWLTKAHVRASGPCSIILARIMLKLGSFGLLKFRSFFFFLRRSFFSLRFSFCVTGGFLIRLIIFRFFDLKYLIACSSIVHIRGVFPLTNIGSSRSILSSLYIIIGHGLVSYVLFFLITVLYEGSYNRSYRFNKSNESSSKRLRLILLVFMFLNLGVPPLINFLSEMWFIYSILINSLFGVMFLFVIILSCIVFTITVATKMLFGKKLNTTNSDMSYMLNLKSIIFFVFLVTAPILY